MEAGRAGWTGKYLSRLFETAVRVGKRARTETAIARGAVSVPQAAVELAKVHFSSLKGLNVLIIGAGQTGRLALQHILPENPGRVFLTNRTFANAEKMAELFGVEALPFENFRSCLDKVNIIIAAAYAKDYLLAPGDFTFINNLPMTDGAVSGQRELFIADISLPRVVDPAVAESDSVLLFDIFDLQDVRDRNLEQRLSEKEKVELIVAEELTSCRQWYDTQKMVPLISRIDEWKTALLSEELDKRKQKLADFSPEQLQLTKRMISACLNKSIHLSYCLLKNGFSEERTHMSEKMAKIVNDVIAMEKEDRD
jgi:glutamyl-tRNA reductase